MYALYSIGPLVERVYGKAKYLVIYFISGIISSVFSFIFSNGVSIGASGAIFGLLGTTLVFAVTMRKNIGKGFLRNITSVIIINLFIGFTMSNIDNFGHLGGLLGGSISALVFNLIKKSER
jgi:rhomboid protease GluP